MKKYLFFLLYIIFVQTCEGSDKPAKIILNCSQENLCKIRFDIASGWKIYAHNENNSESLNFFFNKENSKNVESIQIDWDSQKIKTENFIDMEIGYYENSSDIQFKLFTTNDKYKLALDIQYAACNNHCTVFKDNIVFSGENSLGQHGLLQMLILAFIGGLILNCMPCILPVVWLKVMHISKKCKTNIRKTRIEIFYISLGIITSFVVLASTTIIMKTLGSAVGWGIQFQEPIFVALVALITAFGAINMLDVASIRTPQSIQKFLEKSDGKIGDFLHGIFIVLLATPCTAPFLGTAVAFCLSQSVEYIFAIYLTIGVGLATPYLLLAMVPKALKLLPKPGRWMKKFKIFTAVPFALTSLWMMYILKNQNLYLAIVIFLIIFIFTIRYSIKFALVGLATVGILLISSTMTVEKSGWEEFKVERINQEVKLGRIVLVNITSDWCITCKVNEKIVFSDEKIIAELKHLDAVMIVGDYTSNSETIANYIKYNKRSGIPLSVVYGPDAPEGIVLPVIFTKEDLMKAINRARKT